MVRARAIFVATKDLELMCSSWCGKSIITRKPVAQGTRHGHADREEYEEPSTPRETLDPPVNNQIQVSEKNGRWYMGMVVRGSSIEVFVAADDVGPRNISPYVV